MDVSTIATALVHTASYASTVATFVGRMGVASGDIGNCMMSIWFHLWYLESNELLTKAPMDIDT